MAAIQGAAGADPGRAGIGKIVLASLVGTTIEFYDFYIFGTAAALVFGNMFFPKSAPQTQTLNAYLTFGIAFLARPVGSFLFGHFGDRIGRKSTARRHHADDGRRDYPDRRAAGLRDRRRARAVAARRPAVSPTRRPRRRMGRRGPDRGRKRPRRGARLVRHVPPARAADRLLHRDRTLSFPPRRVRRKGLRRLGVARSLPHERHAGGDRPLRADIA